MWFNGHKYSADTIVSMVFHTEEGGTQVHNNFQCKFIVETANISVKSTVDNSGPLIAIHMSLGRLLPLSGT